MVSLVCAEAVVETGRIHTRLPSGARLAAKVGQPLEVIVDDIDQDGIATYRTWADAPEIDGNLFSDAGAEGLSVGRIVAVEVHRAGEYIL